MSPYLPEDFDAFWAAAADEAKSAPLDFHRSLQRDSQHPTHKVERLDFRGVTGQTLHGWIALPEGAKRSPGFLWIPPYGRESKLPDEYGTRAGLASISFNFFGHEAFHQEVYTPARGYFAQGVEDPDAWVFRRMFQDAFIAMRVLQAQIEVDEDRLAACGMSQGGGLSIWLGAHCPIVKAVCADMPFLSGMNDTLARPVYRYPLKELLDFAETIPLGMERIRNTISYFDTVNQATRCRVPTQVSLGLKDPAVRPICVEATYAALPGTKALIKYEIGHDWHPDMVENNRNWLLRNLGAD